MKTIICILLNIISIYCFAQKDKVIGKWKTEDKTIVEVILVKPNEYKIKQISTHNNEEPYDNGKFIKTWSSIIEAAKFFKKHPSAIYVSITKKCRCSGYLWTYYDKNSKSIENIEPWKTKSTKLKGVIQYDKLGNYLNSFESISKASEINKLNKSNIQKAIVNGWKCGDFIWKYNM